VAREQVLDVGEDQLLVLLLVVEAELEDRREIVLERAASRREERADVRVDVRAVGEDLRQRRPRDEAALGTRVLASHEVVVGIEENAEALVEGLVLREPGLENERLEEPARVGQVPL